MLPWGAETTHIGTALDSVTFAAFGGRRGTPRTGGRAWFGLPEERVRSPPFGRGLDEATTTGLLGAAGNLTSGQSAAAPQVKAEPKLRAYVKPRRSKR